MDAVIEVEKLVRRFGRTTAVDGLDLQVRRGELFAFLGPNGAGKSTTINVLTTLLRPTSGRALIDGHDVVKAPDVVRRSIGVIFQDPSLDERLTALENMQLHAAIYGVPRHQRAARIEAMLSMVELWDRRHQLVRQFSGGMKRRLEIARGLLHRPVVLFLDEPTLGLDPQSRRRIWEHVLALRDEGGVTIFMSTHYMDEAEQCDRVGIIDGGRLIALDTPAGLKRQVGGDVVVVRCDDPAQAAARLQQVEDPRLGRLEAVPPQGLLKIEATDGGRLVPVLVRYLGEAVKGVEVRRPTLEDVFLKLTGRDLRDEDADWVDSARLRMRAGWRR